jgi:hypothetical protein
MGLKKQSIYNATELRASGEVLADGNGTAVRLWAMVNGVVFTLDVTAAETDAEDLLDVYIQTKLDGTNWTDVVHFTTVLGTGGVKRHIGKVTAQLAETMFEVGSALASGAVRNLLGDDWRVRWDVTEAGPPGDTSGSGVGLLAFTFSVTACPL